MRNLQVLAAGSLRDVWKMLMTAFHAESGLTANTLYGPAGLLRQRIEQGEICDLFVSADLQHPEKLRQQGLADHTGHFTNNRLCLTAKRDCVIEQDDWLSLLLREDLRLGTSTPLCDPAGDYTLLLFDHIEQHHPGCGDALRQRAIAMVGGPGSLPVPAGDLAAQWIITTGHAELFIGYASYAPRLARFSQLTFLPLTMSRHDKAGPRCPPRPGRSRHSWVPIRRNRFYASTVFCPSASDRTGFQFLFRRGALSEMSHLCPRLETFSPVDMQTRHLAFNWLSLAVWMSKRIYGY